MANKTFLQGGCHVSHADQLIFQQQGTLNWAQIVGRDDEARRLSLFYFEAAPGHSPTIDTGTAESVLFVLDGQCQIDIGGRRFDTHEGCGLHVRTGENFAIVNQDDNPVRLIASICPGVKGLEFSDSRPDGFDSSFPDRLVDAGRQESHTTSDRYYKLLAGPSIGSDQITQFIGKIPCSKAPEHFHLYEEVLYVLSGEGVMWTGDESTNVRPGSMVFLPRKQRHCMECTSDDGMELVGMFYPAGSPAINYS